MDESFDQILTIEEDKRGTFDQVLTLFSFLNRPLVITEDKVIFPESLPEEFVP